MKSTHGGVSVFLPVFLALVCSLAARPASADNLPYTNTIAASRAYITNCMAQHNIPGCTIVLVESQRVVWAEGFGYADKEAQTPVTTNTVMAIGSVSKLLTALMVLQLVDTNAFDLDACITNYVADFALLPRFAGQEAAWTLRTMLDHHSGIPGDIYNGSFVTGPYWPGYVQWLIDYFHEDYPLYAPQLLASYCNSGVNIAGEAVARHDGVDFTVAAENRVFTPLGMPFSSFLLDKETVTNHLATSYNADGSPAPLLLANMPATGGAYSRPLDMANVIKMLLAEGLWDGNPFLSTNALAEMGTFTPGPLDVDNFFKPGLGLDSVDDPAMKYAGRAWLKSGSTGKFESLLEVLPDQQLGAFVNINCANNMTFAMLRAVLTNAVQEKTGLSKPPLPPMPDMAEDFWTYEQLQAIEGYYSSKTGVDRFIAETNGTLSRIPNAHISTAIVTNYRPHVNGSFYVPGQHAEQLFFTNMAGHDVILRFGSDGGVRDEALYGGYVETLLAKRFTPPALSAAWSNRCGTYWFADNVLDDDSFYADGLPCAASLSIANGLLSLASPGGEATLVPTNDTLAFVAGLSTRGDSCVRIETNATGQERLWFGGYRGVRMDDIPPITNLEVAALSLAMHTNALLLHTGSASGRVVSLRLATNAPDAVLTVISMDGGAFLARGTGAVTWECDADTALIHVASPRAVETLLKAVDVTEPREAMQRTLRQFPLIPGFGVAAQEPGFPPIILAEGYARISPPSTNETTALAGNEHFHIASISKMYTAAAIFLLQQRGLLDIADCVTNHAPELNIPRASEITLELLLEHRSGLPDANNTAWIDDKMIKNPLLEFTVEEIVAVASRLYPNLLFEPGSAYHYTDTGFNILARVVENVSGTNFQAFVRDEVLRPLGLTNTFVPYNHEVSVPEPAVSTYMPIRGEYQDRSDWCPSAEFGCGSVIATLQDLLDMTHAFFMATNLLNPDTHALMMEPLSPGFSTYGRGCSLLPGLGWGHDGTMWGALSTAHVDTNSGVRVSGVMNCQHEDERFLASMFSMYSAAALLKNAMGYDSATLGRQPPTLYGFLDAARQGADYRYQPLALNFPTNWLITGLPDGIGYDPAIGQITGVTHALGTNLVTLVAENAYGSSTQQIPWEVKTSYTNTIAFMTAWITNRMAESQTVGCSIALVDDQEIVWAQGFGYADREAGLPVTTATVFHIGSVSKAFTTAAALQYADAGTLDIHDALTNLVPGIGWKRDRYPDARPVTIQDLMTHQAGLPGDLFRAGFLTRPLGRGYEETTNDLAQTYPVLEPGVANNYCNVAFVLLEGVIEAAAARGGDPRPFEQLVNENMFELLRMDATSYIFDKPAISNHLAKPYMAGQLMPPEYVEIYGTGSMYSHPSDMAAFIKAMFNDGLPVMSRENFTRMTADYSTNSLFDPYKSYKPGLGWDTVADPNLDYAGRLCWKNGATLAYSSMLELLLDHKLGVAVVASSSRGLTDDAALTALQQALLEKTGIHWPTNAPSLPAPTQEISQVELDALAGPYAGSTGYDLVAAHPGSLSYQMNVPENGSLLTNLTYRTNGWFVSDSAPSFALCFSNIHGRDLVLYRQFSGATETRGILSERFQPPVLSAAWSNRLGKSWTARNIPLDDYMRLIGAAPTFSLHCSNGVLYIASQRAASRALVPATDTLAWVPGLNNRGDSALQVIGNDDYLLYAGNFYGPDPETLASVTNVGGAIARPGFSAWYRVAAETNQVVVPYSLSFTNTPATFVVRVFGPDQATLLAEGTAAAPLVFSTAQSPFYICIQPDIADDQTGAYSMTLRFHTRKGTLPAISILLLE